MAVGGGAAGAVPPTVSAGTGFVPLMGSATVIAAGGVGIPLGIGGGGGGSSGGSFAQRFFNLMMSIFQTMNSAHVSGQAGSSAPPLQDPGHFAKSVPPTEGADPSGDELFVASALAGPIIGAAKAIVPAGINMIRANTLRFTWGKLEGGVAHGFRHLEELGLKQTTIHKTIINDVRSQVRAGGQLKGRFLGDVQVGEHRIVYKAMPRGGGIVNVGTYIKPKPGQVIR